MTPHDAMAERRTRLAQQLDHEIVERLLGFAARTYGDNWPEVVLDAVASPDSPPVSQDELSLFVPLALFTLPGPDDERSISYQFVLDRSSSITTVEGKHLRAQSQAYCSLWLAEEVDRGKGATLRDLLTKQRRYVHERLGTQHLEPGQVILGRMVDTNDISFLAGVHPQPMHGGKAMDLADAIRRRFRARSRALKWADLSPPEIQAWIVRSWREWVARAEEPPTLTNTDGDPLVQTVDHFTFDPRRKKDLVERLTRIRDAELEEGDHAERTIVITRVARRGSTATGRSVITGFLRVGDGRLRAETNSAKRADTLRKAVERAGRDLVRHTLREESNTALQLREAAAARGARPDGVGVPRPSTTPPELLGVLQQFKREYYERWLDERIPALGGKTPRQAAKSKASRERLMVLLGELERAESLMPAAERADVSWLRGELGLGAG